MKAINRLYAGRHLRRLAETAVAETLDLVHPLVSCLPHAQRPDPEKRHYWNSTAFRLPKTTDESQRWWTWETPTYCITALESPLVWD